MSKPVTRVWVVCARSNWSHGSNGAEIAFRRKKHAEKWCEARQKHHDKDVEEAFLFMEDTQTDYFVEEYPTWII